MGIELRHIGEDEFKPLVRAVGLGFGMQVDEDTVAALSRPLSPNPPKQKVSGVR